MGSRPPLAKALRSQSVLRSARIHKQPLPEQAGLNTQRIGMGMAWQVIRANWCCVKQHAGFRISQTYIAARGQIYTADLCSTARQSQPLSIGQQLLTRRGNTKR